MSILHTINLPPLILIHSLFLTIIGLRQVFQTPPRPNRQAETAALSGITTLAIGIAYLATSYMPISENQFLHASVPVRIGLALLAGLRMLVVNGLSKEGRNEMLFVFLYDGIGGLVCGWQIGNFSGRVPGA